MDKKNYKSAFINFYFNENTIAPFSSILIHSIKRIQLAKYTKVYSPILVTLLKKSSFNNTNISCYEKA